MSIPTASFLRQVQCEIILAGRPSLKGRLHTMVKTMLYTCQLDSMTVNPLELCPDATPEEFKRICDTAHWLLAPLGYIVERHLDERDAPYLFVTLPPS
jgi:hypothetical protein